MKSKLVLEYTMNCSPLVLYPRLSTPGGLSEWFADDVNVDGKYFSFIWDKEPQRAEILTFVFVGKKTSKMVYFSSFE